MAAAEDAVETVTVRGHEMPLTAFDSFGAYQGWARRFALNYPPGPKRWGTAVACSIAAAVGWCYYRTKIRLVILYLATAPARYGARYAVSVVQLWWAMTRTWWGTRPRIRALHQTFLASIMQEEEAEREADAAQEEELARLRAERADFVLRWLFGAEPMDPDDVGFHSAN